MIEFLFVADFVIFLFVTDLCFLMYEMIIFCFFLIFLVFVSF